MDKNDLIRKLTSRKFWLAVVALVTGLLAAFNVDAGTVEKVSGIIMSGASVVALLKDLWMLRIKIPVKVSKSPHNSI